MIEKRDLLNNYDFSVMYIGTPIKSKSTSGGHL